MGRIALRAGVATATVLAGIGVATPALAGASARPHSFATDQARLEQQLATRQAQLTMLTAEVVSAKNLSSAHRSTLETSLTAETKNIDALVAKVPGDTTVAQLAQDRASMLKDNRVFAVMTPQVVDTIRADDHGARAATDAGEESGLQAGIVARRGDPGYSRAWRHYRDFVQRVTVATSSSSGVAAAVLAQSPSGFPGNEAVFVRANAALLHGSVALAYAAYDRSLIELFVDGYPGV